LVFNACVHFDSFCPRVRSCAYLLRTGAYEAAAASEAPIANARYGPPGAGALLGRRLAGRRRLGRSILSEVSVGGPVGAVARARARASAAEAPRSSPPPHVWPAATARVTRHSTKGRDRGGVSGVEGEVSRTTHTTALIVVRRRIPCTGLCLHQGCRPE